MQFLIICAVAVVVIFVGNELHTRSVTRQRRRIEEQGGTPPPVGGIQDSDWMR